MKQIDARLLAKRKAKEARLQIVAECYSKGLSYSAIRIEVMSRLQLETYSKATVMHDVETLLAQWRAERLPDTEAGVDLTRPVLTTCGSGVTAAILSLGLADVIVQICKYGQGQNPRDIDGSDNGRLGGNQAGRDGSHGRNGGDKPTSRPAA